MNRDKLPASCVAVRAPARLHLGFIDPDGTLGRRFGSLGLVIDGPATELSLRVAESGAADQVTAEPAAAREIERARRLLLMLREAALSDGSDAPLPALHLHLHEVLPAHAGLGSGTQLALAIGRAWDSLRGPLRSSAELATLLGRAERSGIGVAGFERGGVLLDAGPRGAAQVAPLIAHLPFPPDWCVLLVRDDAAVGLHGQAERAAIQSLPPFGEARAAHLAHLVLMRVLPALAERDFGPFAAGISEIQREVGAHFAPAQGGSYTSAAVGRLVPWLGERHGAAVGQSSWGPTGFAMFASAASADAALAAAHAAARVAPGLAIQLVHGRNEGARVTRTPA